MTLQELKDKVGYKEYGRKHGESRFTKFFQNYYLQNYTNYCLQDLQNSLYLDFLKLFEFF